MAGKNPAPVAKSVLNKYDILYGLLQSYLVVRKVLQMPERSFKATLPGTIHQKKNRWWWKVKLPGETKAKDRALKAAGSRYATADRQEAEQLARQIWQAAIKTQAEAKVRAEMAGIIDKQKAEFSEKIRLYSQAMEKAEEKAKAEAEERAKAQAQAQAEAKARAQAEARLNEILTKQVTRAACECCGKEDVPESELVRIDSGQRLCPDCLEALRG